MPTMTEVIHTLTNIMVTYYIYQGWGFCHEACQHGYENKLFSQNLKMVRLTILSDKICRELGHRQGDNQHHGFYVNTKNELCGAFVNDMNVTTVNYTVDTAKDYGRLYSFSNLLT